MRVNACHLSRSSFRRTAEEQEEMKEYGERHFIYAKLLDCGSAGRCTLFVLALVSPSLSKSRVCRRQSLAISNSFQRLHARLILDSQFSLHTPTKLSLSLAPTVLPLISHSSSSIDCIFRASSRSRLWST